VRNEIKRKLQQKFAKEKGREMKMQNVRATPFELVGDFMEVFGQQVNCEPTLRDRETQDLRIDLISEELEELQLAITNNDIVEVADALTDILYVVYGAGHAFGIDLDECFMEVHESNMSKLGEDGKPIYREDGKVLKGPGYFPPNLEEIVV
jgi:predicted HAD superfamily Cof-like phosphohydrolase